MYGVVLEPLARIHREPNEDEKNFLYCLCSGTEVEILSEQGGYFFVKRYDKQGYVLKKRIMVVNKKINF